MFGSKVITWVNSIAPYSVQQKIRKILPVSVKRMLGKKVMDDLYNSGDILQVKDGRKFTVIKDRVFMRVCLDGVYEPDLTAVTNGLIKQDDFVVDIGANFGWYTTLFASIVKSRGEVYAFEPLARTYGILMRNIELNNSMALVRASNVAVGSEEGEVIIGVESNSDSGLARVVDSDTIGSSSVACVALSDVLADRVGDISYIKIDIEGYEMFALQGASKLLEADDQPIIQLELNSEALELAGSSRDAVVHYLSGLGYQFYVTSSSKLGKLKPAKLDSCSDVFCFGNGKYATRLEPLLTN